MDFEVVLICSGNKGSGIEATFNDSEFENILFLCNYERISKAHPKCLPIWKSFLKNHFSIVVNYIYIIVVKIYVIYILYYVHVYYTL